MPEQAVRPRIGRGRRYVFIIFPTVDNHGHFWRNRGALSDVPFSQVRDWAGGYALPRLGGTLRICAR